MSGNRQGGYTRQSRGSEWGRKARKAEAELRGLNNRARSEAVRAAMLDLAAEEEEAIAELIALENDLWGW